MDGFLDTLIGGDLAGGSVGGVESAALVLLLAFVIGHVVSWVYMWTHSGMSYSQMFTASLLVMPVLVALVMVLMASNVLIALGLLAVFSMIRFRNVLKDTRDTTFILWAIAEGVACGTLRFGIAVIAAVTLARGPVMPAARSRETCAIVYDQPATSSTTTSPEITSMRRSARAETPARCQRLSGGSGSRSSCSSVSTS